MVKYLSEFFFRSCSYFDWYKMDLLPLIGDVDEFKEIMGIINKEMDLVSLSDENLRRVFMIFEIAGGVVNGRTKQVD